MLRGLSNEVVGLDVGTTSVKAVRLEHGRGAARLTGVALEEIKPVEGDAAAKEAARLDAVKNALSTCCGGRPKDAPVVTAVSGPGVSIKHVAFPSMPKNELAESIRWEARRHVPFGEAEFVLDFQILDGGSRKGAAEGGMRVLLAAVERRLVDEHVAFLGAAGVAPDTVDLVPLTLMNEADEQGLLQQDAVAVADLGATAINLSIYKKGGLLFARTVPIAAAGARGSTGSTWIDTAVKEVQRSLTFYHNESGKQNIGRVYLSGGRALAPDVLGAFHKATGVETALLDPFMRMTAPAQALEPFRPQGARFALATGLARRRT